MGIFPLSGRNIVPACSCVYAIYPMASINLGQIHQYLQGLEFPADKDEIVSNATERGAGEDVLSAFREMPDKSYENIAKGTEQVGKANTEQM